ncbi:glycosyltransferase [Pedobacter heparinus]|uniref:glycosyltransferase n=1 Tax=Pedobacter heparinus TaxID=984 RepID=UPI0029314E1E|nr:glycosyltransferase [Pedobacter heparinus]
MANNSGGAHIANNKRVVFWSSVEASVFMAAIVSSIQAHGFNVEHRFAISDVYYRKASGKWSRFLLRFRMYIEYPIKLAWQAMTSSVPTINIVTTNTFYAPLISLMFKRSNQEVVHLVWDLFPDVLTQEDNRSQYGWTYGIVNRIVQYIMRKVRANVFLGQRLLMYANSRFDNIAQTFVIPVGANAEAFKNASPNLIEDNLPVNIIYCGNLGTMHDTSTLIEVLKMENTNLLDGLFFSFYASGPMYSQFKKNILSVGSNLSSQIKLGPSLNNQDWIFLMRESHVALVTMKPGSEKLVMPSKTYSAIAAGQAILAICPHNSDLAALVIEEDCGWVVEPGDSKALFDALQLISTDRSALNRKRKNAYEAGQNKYSNQTIALAWVKLLHDISKD